MHFAENPGLFGGIGVVDRAEFFKQVTSRICSSLHIEVALRRTLEYLVDYFPLDELYLDILDANLGAIRRIANVKLGETLPPKPIIPLSKKLWTWVAGKQVPFIMDVDDPNCRALSPLVKLEENSDLVLPLRIEENRIGHLVLRAYGKGKYTPAHADLLASAVEPFAIALANALAHEEVVKYQDILLDDNRFLKNELFSKVGDEVIGGNSGLCNVMEMVGQVAPLNNTVLLLGETGTGKEIIANTIHFMSPRKDGPFIKVNCGAIPESLIDSELFGHEKGAFTGAGTEKRGRFERAAGGTIFLDEIGELPPLAQVRLLRVLQNREIERVGGTKPIPVDIRVIAATHRNLGNMVSENLFREDLWFRLNVFPITIPPLRQRQEDIPALTRHFVVQKSKELGIAIPPPIAPGALERLRGYGWPGNVRELENLVEREIIRHRGGQLMFNSLLAAEAAEVAPPLQEGSAPGTLRLDHAMSLHISTVLKIAKGKIHGPGGAAELLGIKPGTLRARMDKLGIRYGRRR
ncbi:sigma-54-dependent Fis family transcriptional regulator [Geobacter sp. FeAm09]|uniref:sigma-54-dependent Fis family transcriptional regulator n=1 Tax=Geobacter sp. FeAm09 TaxID=2597769 RepID=UPI0011EBDEBB|nr:sigma-54-dependent Fis family transcriptional regulator [Geobacter sp. FeAm09]